MSVWISLIRVEKRVLLWCTALLVCQEAIITAYLMRTEHLSQEDALESPKKSCEFVCPNYGFLDQLKLFEEMGFKVDCTSSIYKCFRLKILGDSYNRGEQINSSIFGANPGMPSEVSSEVEASPNGENKHSTVYRCKKC